MSAGGSVIPELLDDGAHTGRQVERNQPVTRGASLHATEVEQRLDEPVQTVRLARAHVVVLPSSLVRGLEVAAEERREVGEGRERRAELVRDRRHGL